MDILIAEDETLIARDIAQTLAQLGHHVAAVVDTGEDAIRSARERLPDLVLMDIRLRGEMDGVTAALAIREILHIPIVYLTAHADQQTVTRAARSEPFGYLIKPFDEADLQVAIEIAGYKHKMEQRLRTSEQRFLTTIKSIGDGVIVTDTGGRVTFVNEVASRLTAVPAGEAVGMPLDSVFHVFDATTGAAAAVLLAQVLGGDVMATAGARVLVARDGRAWPIDHSASPIRDDHGTITGVVVVFREVSERHAAEEAMRRTNAQLALAVQRLERQTYEIGVLSTLGNELQRCETLTEAYAAIGAAAAQLFAGDDGALFAMRDGARVEPVARWGAAETLGPPPDECWEMRAGETLIRSLPALSCRCTAHASTPHTCLCLPLAAQGVTFGLLRLRLRDDAGGRDGRSLSRERLTVALADQATLGLANVRLRETLREQATRDSLTGLFNRRYLEETLERELRRAARGQHSVGVMMVDIDHFKQVNDTYGHDGGDAVLRAVAMLLTTSVRAEDIVARFGGEEFVLVLPGVAQSVVLERAEQIRLAVRELRVSHGDRRIASLSISVGVTVVAQPSVSVSGAIQGADEALYRAKNGGRDQVVAV